MKSLEAEATEIAVGVAIAFCRAHDIPLIEREDCVQTGVVAALAALPHWKQTAKLSTFLYPRVRGAIRDYRAENTNRGMGSKHVRVAIVSLHDEVPHAHDFDGDPLRYEDVLSYEEPPRGLDDPLVENIRDEQPTPQGLLVSTPELTQIERMSIRDVYGLGRSNARTQARVAQKRGVSQAAVGKALKRGIAKLRKAASYESSAFGANKKTNGKNVS